MKKKIWIAYSVGRKRGKERQLKEKMRSRKEERSMNENSYMSENSEKKYYTIQCGKKR